MTPPQARNAIKKALVEILDPKPRKEAINAMWEHFKHSCAFCGTGLAREKREGHADHLVPSASGGSNAILNRALACAKCNGDEKLDKDWSEFLAATKGSDEERGYRKNAILAWQKKNVIATVVAPAVLAEVQRQADAAIAAFNQAVENVRALRK